MKRSFTFVLLVFALLLCVSCANPYLQEEKPRPTLNIPSASPQIKDLASPEPGKEYASLLLGVYGFDTLNPLLTQNEALRKYYTLVYQSLVAPGKDLSPEPCIAEAWSTSDGGTTWLFKIKENVKYHDGTLCTVYDVKNTAEWISRSGGVYADCVKGIREFSVLTQFSVEIRLHAPDAFFPCKMIFPVLKTEDLASFTTPNGTGMYRFNGKNGESYTFIRNEDYSGAKPRTPAIEIRNYADAAALYESDADIMLCFDDYVLKYAKRAGYSVCPYTDSVLSCLLPSAATSLEVRTYVSSVLDRDLLVNAVIAGQGIAKLLPFAEGTYYRTSPDDLPAQKVGNAPASLHLICNESDSEQMRLLTVVKGQLEAQGTSCEVTYYKEAEYEAAVRAGAYDFAVLRIHIGFWPDFYELFASDGILNFNRYSDASMDSLLRSLRNAYQESSASGVSDQASFGVYARQQTEKIAARAAETLPVIGFYSQNASVFVRNTVQGVEKHNFTYWNTLEAFASWYVEK